jgi:phosphopantothenoylcysteine decarboxylase/phosphopantothenate--cysteine ligase
MGIAIAMQCARRGAKVHLVLGPTSIPVNHGSISVHRVQTAAEMLQECVNLFPVMDLTFMAAAIADYAPVAYSSEKIKKSAGELHMELKKTPDVLKELAAMKRPGQLLVGFALETNDARENALRKLKEKNADLIVLNSLADEGAGFGFDTNKVTIFAKDGSVWDYTLKSKQQVAGDIVDKAIKQMYG